MYVGGEVERQAKLTKLFHISIDPLVRSTAKRRTNDTINCIEAIATIGRVKCLGDEWPQSLKNPITF